MCFSSLYFYCFFPTDRTSALVLVGMSLGAQKLCHETTGQGKIISLKTFNFTVQCNLCERLLKSSTLLFSSFQSQAAPLGFKRLTPSSVGVTIVTTHVSNSVGEMLLKGPSHRYPWFSLKFAPGDCHNLPLE